MPHNVASDQGLHCLLTGFSIKDRIKAKHIPDTTKMTNGPVQHITVEESTSIQWGNSSITLVDSHILVLYLSGYKTGFLAL